MSHHIAHLSEMQNPGNTGERRVSEKLLSMKHTSRPTSCTLHAGLHAVKASLRQCTQKKFLAPCNLQRALVLYVGVYTQLMKN